MTQHQNRNWEQVPKYSMSINGETIGGLPPQQQNLTFDKPIGISTCLAGFQLSTRFFRRSWIVGAHAQSFHVYYKLQVQSWREQKKQLCTSYRKITMGCWVNEPLEEGKNMQQKEEYKKVAVATPLNGSLWV